MRLAPHSILLAWLVFLAMTSCSEPRSLQGSVLPADEQEHLQRHLPGAWEVTHAGEEHAQTVPASQRRRWLFRSDGTARLVELDSHRGETAIDFSWRMIDRNLVCTSTLGQAFYLRIESLQRDRMEWFDYQQERQVRLRRCQSECSSR